jgi:hypothetical protein
MICCDEQNILLAVFRFHFAQWQCFFSKERLQHLLKRTKRLLRPRWRIVRLGAHSATSRPTLAMAAPAAPVTHSLVYGCYWFCWNCNRLSHLARSACRPALTFTYQPVNGGLLDTNVATNAHQQAGSQRRYRTNMSALLFLAEWLLLVLL